MKKLLLSMLVVGSTAYSQSWVEQATGFSEASRGIEEIEIVDPNLVWCIAYDGADTENVIQEFTKTTDGGATWTPGVIDLGDPALAINNISAQDADNAWVSAIDGEAGGGAIFQTNDGGLNWNYANPPLGFMAAAAFVNVVHFFDPLVGLVMGDPVGGDFEIWRTEDGGGNWTQVPGANLPTLENANEFGYNNGNVAIGDNFWFPTSTGNIYRSTDRGVTWVKYTTTIADFGGAVNSASSASLHFSDANNGIIIGTANATAATPTYTLYKTTNGGSTFTSAPYTFPYRSVDYIPGTSTLVGVGLEGTTYSSAYSTDNGDSWTVIDTDVQRTVVNFLNGSTGWAGGFNEDQTTGGIYKFEGSLGVGTVTANAKVTATPNPTNGIMTVMNENASINEVTAFDLLGKQVYAKKFSSVDNAQIDLSSLNTGAYMLKVTNNAGISQVIKIMKN